MYSLPVGNFRFLSEDEMQSFDVSRVSSDSPVGYVLEVDLIYPVGLHAYPLAPEQVEIVDDMISPTLRICAPRNRHASRARVEAGLQFARQDAVRDALQVLEALSRARVGANPHRRIRSTALHEAVHRICNEQRKKATTDFESGLFKLFANNLYGKTVENLRKRMIAKLVTDPQKMVRAAGKVTFKRCEIINSDLVLVESQSTEIVLNKPVAIGFTILEFTKLVMYGFYYDCLLPKFGNKLHLCFTDTDSFICHFETPDLYADIEDISGWFDTSNFHENHFLFSSTNKRVLGKFKSETGDCKCIRC